MHSADIFGAEVQYFRLEPKYWQRVIQQFADSGLRTLTTYVQWNTHLIGEPDADHPAGHFDFEGKTAPHLNLLGFLELVEKAELGVNFRCGPFCCNEAVYGGQPKFLICGDPAWMVWNHKDEPTQGYWIPRAEGMQPSYLHPRYLDLCKHWLATVDEIIRPRLRSNGGFIDMINLDNEISYIVRDGFLDSDYNPVNVQPGGYWHQFLTEKYSQADKLPYGKSYQHIDEVPPPRCVPDTLHDDIARHLDWVEFKEWVMCRYLSELRAMHVANGVEDVVFMTNFNPHLPEGIPTRMPSFEKAVKGNGQGIVGYDFYRSAFLGWSGYSSMARVLKLMNASIDYTWSAEFMAGTWNKDLSKCGRVSDDHMRFMARCALAHGCKSISWFMFHDRLVWGDAPVSSHGHTRPSLKVLTETQKLCSGQIPHWDELQPQGDCAVLYDVTAHRHTAIGDPMPCADGQEHIGAPAIDGVQAGEASREYAGLFRVVEAGGRQAVAVDLTARPEGLNDHRVAFLPGSPIISRQGVKSLDAWVKAGGTLIVSGPWPNRAEDGGPMTLCDLPSPPKGEHEIGDGRIIHVQSLATEEPEQEDMEAIQRVATWLETYAEPPHVHIQPTSPARWTDWKRNCGVNNAGTLGSDEMDRTHTFEQPRTLASAVLHEGNGFPVLFVCNLYVDAVEFELTFGRSTPSKLRCLDTGDTFPVEDGKAIVDIDRKSCAIYAVE